MREAVARFVPDGVSVCMGTALEALIPFAAGHELIRQRRRDLTLIGPISDILFDQLIAAGCVAKIQAAWVGNVSAGLGHNYRRAVREGLPGKRPQVDTEPSPADLRRFYAAHKDALDQKAGAKLAAGWDDASHAIHARFRQGCAAWMALMPAPPAAAIV